MTKRFFIGAAIMASLMYSCSSEDITKETTPPASGNKITLKIEGIIPDDGNPDSRAYMGDDRGVYWVEGDHISVVPESFDFWGLDLQCTADKNSNGKKKATFIYSGDYIDFISSYFPAGSWFTACYPDLTVKPRTSKAEPTKTRVSFMPEVHVQDGKSSNHLKETMVMLSGKIDIKETVVVKDGYATLPPIKFKHKTAVHRFLVTNRREYPLDLRSVKMTALKSGTEEEYPAFNEQVTFHMGTLETIDKGSTPLKYRKVDIKNGNTPYYTLQPGESIYLYASSFATNLSNIDLRFAVTDKDGNTYNTLALPGSKILNGKFEEGKCYTYDLLVDNNLILQGWDTDYISNVDLGQQSFTISSDRVVLPLDGTRKETVTVKTSEADGWKIVSIPEWISASAMTGSTGESQITFSAQTSEKDREGDVIISSGNLNKYIKVVQSANYGKTDAIYLTKDDMKNKTITSYILQDNESTDILYNKSLRSFKTTEPLQSEITTDNKLHLRFYSPRKLTDVQVWASIPSIMNEEFLLAELEEMAPFADVNVALPPFGEKDLKFRTLSGKEITFKAGPVFPLNSIRLRVTSSCPYWKMLQDIKVTWNVSFRGYYNHRFCEEGYIMKAAHCREAVALALNNTYMFSTNEYRDFQFGLQGLIFSDNEGTQFINMKDMYYNRILKTYNMEFGLTTIAGFTNLGVGGIFYILENAYLQHYADDEADKHNYVIWHEFGHVLGYTHDGNVTFPKDNEETGWSIMTAEFYMNMSKEKKLPIYSRRFLHTRDTQGIELYRDYNKKPVKEWYSFGTTPEEDAELYEIDKGDLWYND